MSTPQTGHYFLLDDDLDPPGRIYTHIYIYIPDLYDLCDLCDLCDLTHVCRDGIHTIWIIFSSTRLEDWICTMQIPHSMSYRQVRAYIIYSICAQIDHDISVLQLEGSFRQTGRSASWSPWSRRNINFFEKSSRARMCCRITQV